MSPDTEVLRKRAPTLYGIIVFKVVKGSLFLMLGIMAYCLSDNDLPQEYRHLLELLRIHPDNKFFSNLAVHIGRLTEVKVLWAAAGTIFYSLFSLVEGVGLIFRISWAGWLAIGESTFFIPIEIYELSRKDKFSWILFAVLVVNIFIVWYLFANRHRLFRHHHRHHAEPVQEPESL